MSRHWRHLLWAIPLLLVAIGVLAVLALPNFVASAYHRPTIEGLASSLTGRDVHIRGKLSLGLLPHPEFIANDVTITSPDKETITAASLTLDIAPVPLLRGRISARSITLQSPRIALPWPLPGGAAAIAPPRWLTALHAQISDGVVSIGGITFTSVAADIFTGSDGAFSISGTGDLAGYPLSLSLGFGALSAVDSAPVTMDIQGSDAAKPHAHLAGIYDSSSSLTGTLDFGAASLATLGPSFDKPLSGQAAIGADGNGITLSSMRLQQGQTSVAGSVALDLATPRLSATLQGRNLDIPGNDVPGALKTVFALLPMHLVLDAIDTHLGGQAGITIPALQGSADFSAAGADIAQLSASLPGNSTLTLSGTLNPGYRLQAKAEFDSAAIPDFLAAYGARPALPASWQQASLKGNITGTLDQLSFSALSGNFGPARVSGTAILSARKNLTGALHFDQLDLTPFAAMLQNPPNGFSGDALTGDFEISADRASLDRVPLQHLLIDARLASQLVVRRCTASLYGGLAAASFTLSPNPTPPTQGTPQTGLVSSARVLLALPSAKPVIGLLPAWAALPELLAKQPLAFSFLAAGPADALATSASLTLGPVSITAAPVIDLLHQTAAGAFTLRHPDAIAAFKAFGLKAGLPWPGAGSIALRANMLVSPTQFGFTDFVLSLGDFTGNGKLIYGPGRTLNGEIDADTLALPPFTPDFPLPWSQIAALKGEVTLSASQVRYAGEPVLGPTQARLNLAPSRLQLQIDDATLAGGRLRGEITAAIPQAAAPEAAAAPQLEAKLALMGADASQFTLPFEFPLTLQNGRLDLAADLAANGFAPKAWLATLTGSASLAAHAGTLSGFNLAGIAPALAAKSHRLGKLRDACTTGSTAFDAISVTGNFNSGIYTIAAATLQSPAGSASASGNVDLPDAGIALNVTLPAQIGLKIAGSWNAPRKITNLEQIPPAK